MEVVPGKLTNAQLELLKLFSRPMTDEEVKELRTVLANHYAKKATEEIDRLWDERGYTQQTMDQWLKENS
ncbi:hypothetical protein HRG84_19490 [Flavisolibacter sp. BT320]|nr:hypothetical protein [Flavisolibacter longurius]